MSKLVSENINDYLPAPSEEEIMKRFEKEDPYEMLEKSIFQGFYKMAKRAIERGAEVDDYEGNALFNASKYGHLDIVKLLIENGADPNMRNAHCLRIAITHDHLDIVKYLMENTNVNWMYIDARTLNEAYRNGSYKTLKYVRDKLN